MLWLYLKRFGSGRRENSPQKRRIFLLDYVDPDAPLNSAHVLARERENHSPPSFRSARLQNTRRFRLTTLLLPR